MVFEQIGTLLSSFNIFGTGMGVVMVIITLAIANGLSKDKDQIILNFVALGTFNSIVLFIGFGLISSTMLIATSFAVIIYGFKYLKVLPFFERSKGS